MLVETFFQQLYADGQYLPLLLRKGIVESDHFNEAVRKQLVYFEQELSEDLMAIAKKSEQQPYRPDLIASAITRLVFSMGSICHESSIQNSSIICFYY